MAEPLKKRMLFVYYGGGTEEQRAQAVDLAPGSALSAVYSYRRRQGANAPHQRGACERHH